MIPRAYIDEWRATAPWSTDAWVEQDLVLTLVAPERRIPEVHAADQVLPYHAQWH